MRNGLLTATSALAYVMLTGSALAQAPAETLPEISVQASRTTVTTVGQTGTGTPGVPIQNVSLSYGVSTAGLDLTSDSGKKELKERVHTAAMAACKELSRQFPGAGPSDLDCAKVAVEKAMKQVHQAEAAATKK